MRSSLLGVARLARRWARAQTGDVSFCFPISAKSPQDLTACSLWGWKRVCRGLSPPHLQTALCAGVQLLAGPRASLHTRPACGGSHWPGSGLPQVWT